MSAVDSFGALSSLLTLRRRSRASVSSSGSALECRKRDLHRAQELGTSANTTSIRAEKCLHHEASRRPLLAHPSPMHPINGDPSNCRDHTPGSAGGESFESLTWIATMNKRPPSALLRRPVTANLQAELLEPDGQERLRDFLCRMEPGSKPPGAGLQATSQWQIATPWWNRPLQHHRQRCSSLVAPIRALLVI